MQDIYKLNDTGLPSLTANQFLLMTSIHNTTDISRSIVLILSLNSIMWSAQLLSFLDVHQLEIKSWVEIDREGPRWEHKILG